MDPDLIDPGPVDASVLCDQDSHVSSAIWDGHERGVLRCHEHTSKLGEWRLTTRQIELVEMAGFGYLRRLPSISLDNPLISALVERWRKETNTFHLTVGEMTITLEDVALLLGLAIDGEPVLGVTHTSCKSVCERFLGKVPEAGYMSGGMVKLSWLKEYFSHCSEDAPLDEIKHHTRAYLLYLVGSTIFSTTTGNKVPVMYLPLFEDFEQAGKYAWGAAALAFLYRSLGNASLKSQSTISGCLTLLQCWSYFHLNVGRPKFYQEPVRDCFPLVFWWKGKQSAATVKRDIVFYRKALDSLRPCDVEWRPFKDMDSALIPENIRNSLILGRSKTMLICFDKAERHLPDRCLRQYGMRQGIPENVHQWERKTRGIDSGIHLSGRMEAELNEWSARRLNIVQECIDVEESEYMHWYSSITRKLVGRPVSPLSQIQRTVKFRTKKKRMNTGLRDIAHIADTFATKGLDPLQVESISKIRAIAHACLGDQVESEIIVATSPVEPGKRREKERVRRNTNGKRKRKDESMEFNTAGEDDQIPFYGSEVGVDQVQSCHAIIEVDHSHQMMDHSHSRLGKRVRRREKSKKKTSQEHRQKEYLVKCDAVTRNLQSDIAVVKEDQMQLSYTPSKDNQLNVSDGDLMMKLDLADGELDCLPPGCAFEQGEKADSYDTAGESETFSHAAVVQEIAECSHAAGGEGRTVESSHAAGGGETVEASHGTEEGENADSPHAAVKDKLSGPSHCADEKAEPSCDVGEGEKSESHHTAGEGEKSECSNAAVEAERANCSHAAVDEGEVESSYAADECQMADFSIAACENKKAGSSLVVDETVGSSYVASEDKKVESSGVVREDEKVDSSHAASEKLGPSQATSCAANAVEEGEYANAGGNTEKGGASVEIGEDNKAAFSVAAKNIDDSNQPLLVSSEIAVQKSEVAAEAVLGSSPKTGRDDSLHIDCGVSASTKGDAKA